MSVNMMRVCDDTDEFLTSSNEYSALCDQTDLFYKKLDNISEIIHYRGDVFSQKKEKYMNLKDYQISKMKKEKEEYLKKIEELSAKIEGSKAELAKLECTISELQVKHSDQKQINNVLKEKFNGLQLEVKEKQGNFKKTLDNYTTVINWYEYFLHMNLELDKENTRIVSIKFNNRAKNEPHAIVEIVNEKTFKVLKVHPLFDQEVTKSTMSKPELMSFLYKLQKYFKE